MPIPERVRLLSDHYKRRFATRWLHGPRRVELADDEVMVVSLMRDAAWFVGVFLDHHFALGARHILIIDNGSTDDTVAICRSYGDRVTVARNTLPVKVHEAELRSEIAQRVARGGWLLFADADELAELPAPVADLLQYCNAHRYTAVLGQMLDRFSDEPYNVQSQWDYRTAVEAMDLFAIDRVDDIDYFNTADISFHWYLRDNVCAEPRGRFKKGGLRREVFGEEPFLSKHSLARNLGTLTPMTHPHCASGVAVADVDLLLHHYKLAGDWVRRDNVTASMATWPHGEDILRLARVGGDMNFRLTVANPQPWRGLAPLQQAGFLAASDRFLAAQQTAGTECPRPR